jgi:hypothetical protein
MRAGIPLHKRSPARAAADQLFKETKWRRRRILSRLGDASGLALQGERKKPTGWTGARTAARGISGNGVISYLSSTAIAAAEDVSPGHPSFHSSERRLG